MVAHCNCCFSLLLSLRLSMFPRSLIKGCQGVAAGRERCQTTPTWLQVATDWLTSRGRGQANAAGRKAEARENHGRLRKSAQYKNKTKSPSPLLTCALNESVQNLWSWEKEKRNTFLLPMNEKGVCGYNFN